MCGVPVDELGLTQRGIHLLPCYHFGARIEERAARKIRKEMGRKTEIWLLRFIFCH